jgi:hypothetical protein
MDRIENSLEKAGSSLELERFLRELNKNAQGDFETSGSGSLSKKTFNPPSRRAGARPNAWKYCQSVPWRPNVSAAILINTHVFFFDYCP